MKLKLLALFLCSVLLARGEKHEDVIKDLEEHSNIIKSLGNDFALSPRLIASIIYAERMLNFDWDDGILDGVLAEMGHNSSIGFAQIKLNTAFWIEEELSNPGSRYYNQNLRGRFRRSRTRSELVGKLRNDETNLLYCVGFIGMIERRWMDAGIFIPSESKPGIIASLYSIGGRKPHSNPQMNDFGRTAQEFYDSFDLLNLFPK